MMSTQRIIYFTLVPLTALALIAALVFLTAGPSMPLQAAGRPPSRPTLQQMHGTMPMIGTIALTLVLGGLPSNEERTFNWTIRR